ncbi:MAG: alpha/beta hydrolase [Gammaproteobacteria bacterium]|nr:alpha/beta hydrolase [Gammaproteobacteria bacterium]
MNQHNISNIAPQKRETLFFIPGTMCTEMLWRKLVPYLRDEYDLIYLDIPNDLNFEQLANYYALTLTEKYLKGNEKVNLIGFSLGGYIAAHFATLFPEHVNNAVIIANSPTQLPEQELKQRADTLKFVKKHGYKGMSHQRILNLLDASNQSSEIPQIINEMDSYLGQTTFISQYQNTSEREDLASAIIASDVAFHFYHSEQDPLVQPEWFSKVQNKVSSVFTTAGSGHMLPLEKPLELAEIIKQNI